MTHTAEPLSHMKHLLPALLLLVITFVATACHRDEDDIMATAAITLSAGDTLTIERIQGTARLTNLNTRQVTTTSDFDGATLRLQLLRSSYSADMEGLMRYHDSRGQVFTKHVRAHSDYMALDQKGYNATTLDIIFLE